MEANGEVSQANHVGKREVLKWKNVWLFFSSYFLI
jgi:hypothetical protein